MVKSGARRRNRSRQRQGLRPRRAFSPLRPRSRAGSVLLAQPIRVGAQRPFLLAYAQKIFSLSQA